MTGREAFCTGYEWAPSAFGGGYRYGAAVRLHLYNLGAVGLEHGTWEFGRRVGAQRRLGAAAKSLDSLAP